ncbi:HNH endonuclease [Rhizobium leguminosarum]|uniref:HNH endonuclease n=1 Tax=Rhizobium leguminosarum TaxID=384 RepID=UPI0009B62D5F|nr:HNH endonuclease [Rhizobium leguminosarum]
MDFKKLTQDRIRANIKVSLSGCWEWQLYIRRNGYGQMKHDGKTVDAHRVSYECFHHEIPAGMFVCHRCDNRKCANPDHLFLGTAQDNSDDMVAKDRPRGRKPKLTDEQIQEAMSLRRQGLYYHQIAAHFGVTTMCIHNHLNAPANDNECSTRQTRASEC